VKILLKVHLAMSSLELSILKLSLPPMTELLIENKKVFSGKTGQNIRNHFSDIKQQVVQDCDSRVK
jgi:hypothetical protein